ncbi:MFS transporter [Streptomyces sp. NBC_00503]|uniref:MFS transporter n=1 Tax=Streptomyces sp. NBC_00503 TaxID=2903659 RepID=UPI002E80D7D4|nr:MFS transporter [Streptomyces sp. NBC_00503]WUD84118.1 MFS transporter [Streptomyces sp. NBC_00503]
MTRPTRPWVAEEETGQQQGATDPGLWRIIGPFGVSFLADGLATVMLPLLALNATRAPIAVGLVAFCRSAPWAFFAPFAGVLVDYWDRRRVLVLASAVRCAVLVCVAAMLASGAVGLSAVIVTALVLGICEVAYDTAAQTVMPSVMPGDRLNRANARLSAVETVSAQFAGPALAGILAALALTPLTLSTALVYAAALFLVRGLRIPRQDAPSGAKVLPAIREGFRFLWDHRALRTLTWATALGATAFAGWFAQFALYAVTPGPMGLATREFGLILAVSAAGSLAAALAVPLLHRVIAARFLLPIAIVFIATGMLLPVCVPGAVAAAAGLALYGAAVVVWNVITVTYRQQQVPDRLLGRVTAAYRTLAWGAAPLGALAGGVVGQYFGVRTSLVVFGLMPLFQIPALLLLPLGRAEQQPAPAPDDATL